jgi:hypothetical protein
MACSIKVTSLVSLIFNPICQISGNLVKIYDAFNPQGYNPESDGPLAFTLTNILVNNESNGPYGDFKVEMYDKNVLVASSFYSST